MKIPKDLVYTKEHEWIRINDNILTIGITDFAQGELGDIIFVEFPEIGEEFQKEDPFGTIEAVKTVADIFAPVQGKIIEINHDIENSPEVINADPYGEGWLMKIEITEHMVSDGLLSPEDYELLLS
ncbi:MAG TPA: glycine cleavage system protein GcvH [Candidatus Marinimicrobia bacterium]|nr:glycine cleavage system protein H [Candidatus Neomarinimicrobiota bacterium]MDP6142846.1 glycine cleavage system protein GcvH [Candidatus Neomarinimicrobiota bacterium]MDP6261160.1 glycine cleavage system protein GcvH [Candidatus Neomarinimicrobiota bacterium]MDP7127256.1 glycine cleavage system protein GcvH [Candidatus Neomarinimicrobiota bacterium]MDP7337312.1 glycine cleavage system protein GcvH [Candidatus Neomarinimicrobiota bacterium]